MPLFNRQKLHIVLLTRKCLDGSVPPYLINYFTLNASVYTVTIKCIDDIHIPKVNLEVAKRSFYFTGTMEFNSFPRLITSKESFIEFSKDVKDFFY